MTRLLAVGMCLLLLAGIAQCGSFSLRPSIFETYAGYTDSRRSSEQAGFVTLAWHDRQYLTVGYSDQRITHPDWTYHRQMPVSGVLLSHRKWLLKAYYAHIEGQFTSTAYGNYDDRADLGNAELVRVWWPFETGLACTRFQGNGSSYAITPAGLASRQTVDQITGRILCVMRPQFSVTARHNYTHISDGRTLWSLAMNAVYVPRPRWTITAGGFIGERAYYFDNDLLIVYDQNDTQRGMAFGQIEAPLFKTFSFSAEYIYTHFEPMPYRGIPGAEYSVRYLVAGLKSRFSI